MFFVKRKWPSFLVVSDLHAGGGGRADDFRKHADLFESLMWHCHAVHLPVVGAGDWFETWQFKRSEIEREHARHFAPVRELARDGMFAYAYGNHDEDIGLAASIFGDHVGEYVEVDTGAGVWRIEHGHQHDKYNASPGLLHRVGLWIGRFLEEKVSSNIDVLDNYRRTPSRDGDALSAAAKRYIDSGRYRGVGMGHTHRSNRIEFDRGGETCLYLNAGAWTEARIPSAVLVHGCRGGVVPIRNREVFKLIRP